MMRVLFIDDNEDLCFIFKTSLEQRNFSVTTFLSGREALDYLVLNPVDVVISDYSMPEMDGLVLLKEIKSRYPSLPFIMLTGEDNKETAIEALNSGADFYQNKSGDMKMQILDIAEKIRILGSKGEADRAVRHKDSILEAVSFAADQFLRGNSWEDKTEEILKRLCLATRADRVSLFIRDEQVPASYTSAGSWSGQQDHPFPPVADLPDLWYDQLAENQVIIHAGTSPGNPSLLIIPSLSDGMLSGYLLFEDIMTGRNRNEIELNALRTAAGVIGSARYKRHIEEFFKSPVEEAIIGIFLICDGTLRYVNNHFCQIFGYQRHELLSEVRLPDLIRSDLLPMLERKIGGILKGSDLDRHFEIIGIHRDGYEMYLDLFLTTVKSQGSLCITGNLIEITDRKKMEHALRESEERYRLLAEHVDDLILLIGPDWSVQYLNPAAIRVFGPLPEGISLITDLFRDDMPSIGTQITDVQQERTVYTDILHIHRGEEERWYDLSVTPLHTDSALLPPVLLYLHDISERIMNETEIRRQGLAQIELNMEQFQILNDEIRNPLQVIKALNALDRGEFSSRIEEQISRIDDLITQLDKAWIQSEKVHRFLLKHFRHGEYADMP